MNLPFQVDENSSIQIFKTNINQFISKISGNNFENLINNHQMKFVCKDNVTSISSLKDWFSEEVGLNTNTGFKNVFPSALADNFIAIQSSATSELGTNYPALKISNTVGKNIYQNFSVKNVEISDKLTVIAVYKLALYRKSETQSFSFIKYVTKGDSSIPLTPFPDLNMNIERQSDATELLPIEQNSKTGSNCVYIDSFTYMDIKQYSVTTLFKDLRLKVSSNSSQGWFDGEQSWFFVAPAIVGFYVYNSDLVIPGLIENVKNFENSSKYTNGKWQLTNDGFNFKSLLDYTEVKVGLTNDAEFPNLTQAKAHASNSDKIRKYVLTSNITETSEIEFNTSTEIDGRGFTINCYKSFSVANYTNPSMTFTVKDLVLNKGLLNLTFIDNLNIKNLKVIKDNRYYNYDSDNIVVIDGCSGYFECSLRGDNQENATKYVRNPLAVFNCNTLNIQIGKIENFGVVTNEKLFANAIIMNGCQNINVCFGRIDAYLSVLDKPLGYDIRTEVNAVKSINCLNCSVKGTKVNFDISDVYKEEGVNEQ